MPRAWMWVGVVAGLALPVAASAQEPLENHFGKTYAVLVSVGQAATLKASLERTNLWGAWRSEGVRRWLETTLGEATMAAEQKAEMPFEEMLGVPRGEAVFGLAPPEPGSPAGKPRFAILARLGEGAERAKQAFESLRERSNPPELEPVNLPDGTACLKFGTGVAVAIKGDVVGIADSTETLASMLKDPPPPADRLVETDRFKAAMKPFTEREPGTIYGFVDLARLGGPGSGAEAASQPAEAVTAVGFSARPVDRQIAWRVHLPIAAASRGVTAGLGRGTRALLAGVPQEAVAALALRYDLSRLADQGSGVQGQPAVAILLGPLAAAVTDPQIRRDLWGSLGDDVVAYILPPEGGGWEARENWVPRLIVQAGVRDAARLGKVVDLLAQRLQNAANAAGGRYEREMVGQVAVHAATRRAPLVGIEVELALAATGKHLVFGTRRGDVAAVVSRADAPAPSGLLQRPEVTAALDRVGGDGAMLVYGEFQPLGESLRGIIGAAARLATGAFQAPQPGGPAEPRPGTPAPPKQDPKALMEECQRRMQTIKEAIEQYAQKNGGAVPPSLNALVEANLIEAKMLTCPASGVPYHYVHYQGKKLADLSRRALLAYELSAPHDPDRVALYVDGVKVVANKDFGRELAMLPFHLRGKEPSPHQPPGPGQPGEEILPGFGDPQTLDALLGNLTPHVGRLSVEEDGLSYAAETFAAPLEVALIGAALLASPASAAGPVAPVVATAEVSQERLQRIGQAIVTYALDHDAKMPAALDDLLAGNLLDAESLQCPGADARYAYRAYADKVITDLEPGDILAYEPVAGPDGRRLAVFLDGRVQAITKTELEKALGTTVTGPTVVEPTVPRPPDTEPRPPDQRPTPAEVPLDKQLSSWLTMAQAYLDRNRFDRCAEYCRKVLEKAPKGSLFEYRANRMLETCKKQGVKVD